MIQLKRLKMLLAILSALLLILAAGCSGDVQSSKNSVDTKSKIEQSVDTASGAAKISSVSSEGIEQRQTITIYFPDANGEKLIAAQRQIDPERADVYAAAVQSIIDGPMSESEGIAIVPKGAKLLGVDVKNGIATVDFSREFQDNFSGGSTGELMLIGSIVDTLTQFDDIKSVRIRIEGRELDSLSGHLDLSIPQQRMTDLLSK